MHCIESTLIHVTPRIVSATFYPRPISSTPPWYSY